MSITFKFEGGRELERKLAELADPKRMRSAARSALRKGAEPMVSTARALVPLDRGDLFRSIKQGAGKARRGGDPDRVTQLVGIDRNEQPPKEVARKQESAKGSTYRDPGVAGVGPIIEFGRPEQGVPPQPFLRPAFDARKEESVKIIGTELGKAIERQAKIIARKKGG